MILTYKILIRYSNLSLQSLSIKKLVIIHNQSKNIGYKMLNNKLRLAENAIKKKVDKEEKVSNFQCNLEFSKYFNEPFWKTFYEIEKHLNADLQQITLLDQNLIIYNPIEYAKDIHVKFLMKYLNSPKELVLIGMNPGPNGMTQTGISFGNMNTVRNYMKISGNVEQPPVIHPSRLVYGMDCTIEEPSGIRIWGLIMEISGDINTFSQQCFIHTFCPLSFYDSLGRNITPSELKGCDKKLIRDICLKHLKNEIKLLRPKVIVTIGSFVWDSIKELRLDKENKIIFLKMPHPSPRSLNNHNWKEKARLFFEDNDLTKYMKNDLNT